MMNYCVECGTRLVEKYLEGEGMIPYCETCKEYRFPIFSTAVSMEVQSPDRKKILLIKQYGKDRYVLVAGYINQGENAEHAVKREVREEIGVDVSQIHFEQSEYFPNTNTLMLNFSCVASSEDLSHVSEKEIDECQWFSRKEAREKIAQNSLAGKFLCAFLK
ncbi:MAG: NUDIX domain-containing protein [Lachnospiraceae bacterium]|nr:NUDIX domain-containing protein [Lachnospiraceae bacterium]MDY5497369.1 NUDIX domain-containing protein [Anaerobutyricum sp.]